MKDPVRRRWPWLLAILAIVAAGIVFRLAIIASVVEPIAWLLWAGWRILASVDQRVLWLILVAICIALVLRVVPLPRGVDDEDQTAAQHALASSSRLAHWESVATSAARGGDGRTALLVLLRNLAETVADATRRPLPPEAQDHRRRDILAALSGLLPGSRRRQELRQIEALLNWMESTLEIAHER